MFVFHIFIEGYPYLFQRNEKMRYIYVLKELSVILSTSFHDTMGDIEEKTFFPKFQLIQNFPLQFMHDYVH